MKKLGFTLIELLAVILILGIIALIAIPTVNNIIKESKKGAFKSSVQNIVSSIEQKCRIEQLKGEEITKYYRFEDGVSLTDAGFKGEVPTDGSVIVDDDCNIDIVINKENYIAIKSKEEDRVTIIEDKYYAPGTPVVYNPGDNNYTNWYVVKDNGDTVTLLSSRSFTNSTYFVTQADFLAVENSATEYENNRTKHGPLTVLKKMNEATSSWSSEAKLKIRLLTVEEVIEILGINNYVYGTSIYLDSKSNEEITQPEGYVNKYAWLFNNICDSDDCTDYPFWLNDVVDNNSSYMMNANNLKVQQQIFLVFDVTPVEALGSIRPVITIPKSSITNN